MMGRMAKQSALVLVLAALVSGCSGSICEDAISKMIDTCDLGGSAQLALPAESGECKGDRECSAECVLEADCEDLIDDDMDNGYFDCLADCLD